MPMNTSAPVRNIGNIDDWSTMKPELPKKEMDKDAFLHLMITQLRNQDPTNPQDNSQMIAQTAQFSQLEQLTNMTAAVDRLVAMQQQTMNFNAAAYIGLEARALGNTVQAYQGMTQNIEFKLPEASDEVQIMIYNSQGSFIDRLDVGALGKGLNSIAWDAYDSSGQVLPDGHYTYRVVAFGDDGNPMDVETYTYGLITAVRNEGGVSLFMMNNEEFLLEELESFYMPNIAGAMPDPGSGGEEDAESDMT